MLGKILQTVGERMAFYYDGHEGYHTAARFGFRRACSRTCNHWSLTKTVVTTIVRGAGGDVSQRACTGSEATK